MHPEADLSPVTIDESLVLSADQQAAREHLVILARVRANVTRDMVPTSLLRRWTVPLLVGPAGAGKAHVCQEVARQLGNVPFRRWEAGAWSAGSTGGQIQSFAEANPRGCVVYLAGIDALAVETDRHVIHASYHHARACEIEQTLERLAARHAHALAAGGDLPPPSALVIVGGRFPTLWGEHDPAGPTGAEAWRSADREPLCDARAVSSWLAEHSGLPSGIRQRLACEPLVLPPLSSEEAGRLAEGIVQMLPPALDGVEADELAAVLCGPGGWQAVAGVIERALISGYEAVPADAPSAVSTSSRPPAPVPPAPKSVFLPREPELSPPPAAMDAMALAYPPARLRRKDKPARLAERLQTKRHRSSLLPLLCRLGLVGVTHLQDLAKARGYILPDGDGTKPPIYASQAWRDEIQDVTLTIALLSPGLEYSERALCRGTLMLRRLLRTTSFARIGREAGREGAYGVVRHIALLGRERQPQNPGWRGLLLLLPSVSDTYPALPPGSLPDAAIADVLAWMEVSEAEEH